MDTQHISVFSSSNEVHRGQMGVIFNAMLSLNESRSKFKCQACKDTGQILVASTTLPEENEWVECTHGE